MHKVTPKVFLVGETSIIDSGLNGYLNHINTKWRPDSDTSDSEKLIEVYGRMCYRSFEPKMNPNVNKIREGNSKYISNIIKSKHGSVIEHAVTNWILVDISRVVTHEMVRHRAGTAFSQESLRYVRLDDLGLWLPPGIDTDPHLKALFEQTFEDLGQLQIEMAKYLKLDEADNFHYKKKFTSAMRRLAPDGVATSLGMSLNFRALRHIAEMRTSEGAEVEIRFVVDQMITIAKERYPNIFADFKRIDGEDGIGQWVPENSKV